MDVEQCFRMINSAVEELFLCFTQSTFTSIAVAEQLMTNLVKGISWLLSDGMGLCLPQQLLLVVKRVLELCQAGESCGGELVEAVAPQLGNTFKKTYSLLKCVLDKLVTDDIKKLVGQEPITTAEQPFPDKTSDQSTGPTPGKSTTELPEECLSQLPGQPGKTTVKTPGQLFGQSLGQTLGQHSRCWSYFDILKLLVDIGTVSLHFDPAVLVLCWRTIGKLVISGSSPAPLAMEADVLTVNAVKFLLQELCTTMVTVTKQCVAKEDRMLEKRLKCGRFLTSLLVRLLGHNPESAIAGVPDLHNLLLSTHQLVYSEQSESLRIQLQNNLLLLRDPVVEMMCAGEAALPFLQTILDSTCVCEGQAVSWLLCLCGVLRFFPSLPEHIKDWCLDSSSSSQQAVSSCRLLDTVFKAVSLCHVELSVPMRVSCNIGDGHPHCEVSLYELVCCHVCALCPSLDNHHLPRVEMNLFSHLLESSTFCGLLAEDMLLFICRMVGDHLSQRYCEVLLKLSQEGDIGNNTSWNLILVRSLWSRIMAALPASVQKATILSSSLSNLVHVCICMDLHCLHPDLLKEVLARVLPDCLNILTTSDSSTEFERSAMCLLGVCSCYSDFPVIMEPYKDALVLALQTLMSTPLSDPELCLHVTALVLPILSPEVMAQVLSHLSSLFSLLDEVGVCLAVCNLLFRCAPLKLHQSVQNSGQQLMVKFYSCLLLHKHWLVQHQALKAFKRFAETSPYPHAVESTVSASSTELVLSFLQKIPHKEQFCQSVLMNCLELSHPLKQLHSISTLQCSTDSSVTSNTRCLVYPPPESVQSCSLSSSGKQTLSRVNQTQDCSGLLENLELTWQKVERCAESLSAEEFHQLTLLHSAMANFLAVHADSDRQQI